MADPVQGNKVNQGAAGGSPWPVAVNGTSTVTDPAVETVLGTTADTAVTDDQPGSVSGKLRGLTKILTNVWDSLNGWLKVSVQNATLAVTQSGAWTVTNNQGTANAGGTAAWPVQGAGAVGAAVVGNPHRLGVSDGTNLQEFRQANITNTAFTAAGVPQVGCAGVSGASGSLTAAAVQAPVDTLGYNVNGWRVIADQILFTGANGERGRTPKTFKTAVATASGSTAVWTPTSSKKFRLMRYQIEISANASLASAGILTVDLLDSAASTAQTHSVFLPSAAGTTIQGAWRSGWIDLSNGVLSALANNVLNVNLSAALATGTARVIVAGTEE